VENSPPTTQEFFNAPFEAALAQGGFFLRAIENGFEANAKRRSVSHASALCVLV
jgi:hypothetical protein